MTTALRLALATSVAALIYFVDPGPAHSQPDLTFEADAEEWGYGYRLAPNAILHASAGLHGGYTNNVFYEEEDEADSAILRFLAKIWLQSDEETDEENPVVNKALKYRAGLSFHWDEYLADASAVDSQSGFDLGLLGGIGVTVFEGRPISFFVDDTLVRDQRPPNFETSGQLERVVNRFRLGVRWSPPTTLSGELSYTNTIDIFEDDDLEFAHRMRHLFSLRANWEYLPRSRAYAQVTQGINHHAFGENLLSGQRYKATSYPLTVRVGTETTLTERSSASAFVGWAVGFYDEGADYNSPIVGARYNFRYSPTGRVSLFGERQFEDSINANFYSAWVAGLQVNQTIAHRVALMASAKYARRTFEGIPDQITMQADERDDHLYEVSVQAKYAIGRWWKLAAGYQLDVVDTDFIYMPDPSSDVFDDPGFVRHHAFIGTEVIY